jgi:hypothetical protein
MKRIAFVALLALALPLAAFANTTTDFNFSSWNTTSSLVVGSDVTMSTMLTGVSGYSPSGDFSGDLGTMSLTTGTLLSTTPFGSDLTFKTYAGGGSFMIMGNGTDGLPSGTIFKGTFSGDLTLLTLKTGTSNGTLYVLTCAVDCSLKGSLYNGTTMTSATGTLVVTDLVNKFGSTLTAETSFQTSVTPEPSTLGLLGTGLLGLGAVVRRKVRA